MGISFIDKFEEVANFYKETFYKLGYSESNQLGNPLIRTFRPHRPNNKPYYQVSPYTFSSFLVFYEDWYYYDSQNPTKRIKKLPNNIKQFFTPLVIALWAMGDGYGAANGSFVFCSESFSKEENELLCDLFFSLYGIKASLQKRGNVGNYRICISKESASTFFKLISHHKPSCFYKFQ